MGIDFVNEYHPEEMDKLSESLFGTDTDSDDDIYDDASEEAFQVLRADAHTYMRNKEEALIKRWLNTIGFTEPVGYYLTERIMEIYTTRPGVLIGKAGVHAAELRKMLSEEFFGKDWDVKFFEIRGGITNIEPLKVDKKQAREDTTKKHIKTVEVYSANHRDLIAGVIPMLFIITIEILCIISYMMNSIDAITLIITMQIAVLFLAVMSAITIGAWKHRAKFNLHFCRLIDDVSITYIKENYSIQKIDEYGILFVDNKDVDKYMDWNLLHGYGSLIEAEVILFK